MASPELSVVIPIFNRGEIVRYTFESVRRASTGLDVETIVVDDGSSSPVSETLTALGYQPTLLLRQENRGLLYARLAGLERANGRYVLFLDSDDLVGPDKFRAQLSAMAATRADVSTSDVARCKLEGAYDALRIIADPEGEKFSDCASFFILGQPPPHGPIYRTEYLKEMVARAFFPPSSLYNSVAEIWLYYNAAAQPGRVVTVRGAHTIVGSHAGGRLTSHWENLGVASLAVVEAFARSCPECDSTLRARKLAGGKAFVAWRALPRGFSPDYASRLLGLWRRLPRCELRLLGGPGFRMLARLLGPEKAALVLRRWQALPYDRSRTMTDEAFSLRLATLPPP